MIKIFKLQQIVWVIPQAKLVKVFDKNSKLTLKPVVMFVEAGASWSARPIQCCGINWAGSCSRQRCWPTSPSSFFPSSSADPLSMMDQISPGSSWPSSTVAPVEPAKPLTGQDRPSRRSYSQAFIGRAPTLLRSHWFRASEWWNIFIVLPRQLPYAIKNKLKGLKAPTRGISCLSFLVLQPGYISI